MNNVPLVKPVIITSPFSGSPMRPQIRVRESEGQVYTEAHWYCPDSGRFVRKGIVKIEPANK